MRASSPTSVAGSIRRRRPREREPLRGRARCPRAVRRPTSSTDARRRSRPPSRKCARCSTVAGCSWNGSSSAPQRRAARRRAARQASRLHDFGRSVREVECDAEPGEQRGGVPSLARRNDRLRRVLARGRVLRILRGTLIGDRLRLERVDSQLGYTTTYYGRLARDGGQIAGTWESTTYGVGAAGTGRWRAAPANERSPRALRDDDDRQRRSFRSSSASSRFHRRLLRRRAGRPAPALPASGAATRDPPGAGPTRSSSGRLTRIRRIRSS